MTSVGQALRTAVQRMGPSGAGTVEEGCLSECTLVLRTLLVFHRSKKKKSKINKRVHGTPQETQDITKKEHYTHKNYGEERWDQER